MDIYSCIDENRDKIMERVLNIDTKTLLLVNDIMDAATNLIEQDDETIESYYDEFPISQGHLQNLIIMNREHARIRSEELDMITRVAGKLTLDELNAIRNFKISSHNNRGFVTCAFNDNRILNNRSI